MGIIGRVDDMFTVRGENVYPSEIDAVLNQTEGYGGEHRIVITRDGAMDELAVKVEATSGVWEAGEDRIAAFRRGLGASLQKLLGLRAVVEIVPQHSLERTDFKARRVIDDRDVLNEMRRRLSEASSS
jgi:phenylacetate-CoA ligase